MPIFGAINNVEISQWHMVWIMQDDVRVVGYLGEGTSKEIVSNWDTPFADTSLESKFRQITGVIREVTDKTLLTKFQSQQVWAGNQPYTFNLVMKFRAFSDPLNEVEKAIEALEIMMAPDPKGKYLPKYGSRLPQPVQINFGRRQLLTDCCIRSMSVPQDKERDKNGHLIRADVSLIVETLQSVTKTDLEESRNQSDFFS